MKTLIAIALALAISGPAIAANPIPQRGDALILNNTGFLGAHPDLRWRREGQATLEKDRPREAFTYFMRAARYADKPSQAMVAEMLWTGNGVAVDRPLAYAWMDIAAERAYVPFVAKREAYWNALSEAERAQALEVGHTLYGEYRDEVAQERLERELEKAKRKITGSRTGFVGFLEVQLAGSHGTPITVSAERFYDDRYWEPDQYWEWQDTIWKDPGFGTVTVKPLEVVRDEDEGGE